MAAKTTAPRWPEPRREVRPHDPDELRATLPKAFEQREYDLIAGRRERIGKDITPPEKFVGLALSGDGVRGATFNLGFLQAMARHHVLRTVDYLSTVSGGGYIGSFLGRFYTRFINRPDGAVTVIESRLSDGTSPEVSWLRRCSGYMAVNRGGGAPVTAAILLRSFLTVHLIVGAMLVAGLTVANLFRYGAFTWILDRVRPWFSNATRLSLAVELLPSVDPWLWVFAIVVVTCFLPLSIAYWLPSPSRAESFERSRLVAFMICFVTLFVMSLEAGAGAVAVGILTTTVAVFVWVEAAWARVALKTPAATGHPIGRAMVRAKFSRWLATAMAVATVALVIWLLDDLVFRLYPRSMPLRDAFGVLVLTVAFLFGPLRWLALWFLTNAPPHGWDRRTVWRVLSNPFLLPAASAALLLIQWDLVSHAMFRHGADVGSGIVWTVVALLISAILGGRSGIVLVNWSSLQVLYAARGSRTYLGASNPYRHAADEGADVTSPQAEDDIAFGRYRPDLAGGPLHIINVLANQSIDRTSGRRTRDRRGHNMAVGPCGISVGPASHAIWATPEGGDDVRDRLVAVGGIRDLPAPFEPRVDSPHVHPRGVQTSPMQLSDWMAISGASLSSGEYADTSLGASLLCGLANLRSGFWWDSGIDEGDRFGEPIPPTWRRLWRWFKRRFRTQSALLAELTGRFAGPCRHYWHLSDGGFADLGVYELVRRRVPIIICADATRDVDGGLAALANARRRVQIDFGAEIEFLSPAELQNTGATSKDEASRALPQSVLDALGTLDDIRSSGHSGSRKHAAVARVRYKGTNTQSVLLYIKASMTGDEPLDVREYHRQHHRFPHQSVLDQFLNEAQWESYRALGEHCANPLFSEAGVRWLVDVLQALPRLPGSTNASV
jgi:hypothetical protein